MPDPPRGGPPDPLGSSSRPECEPQPPPRPPQDLQEAHDPGGPSGPSGPPGPSDLPGGPNPPGPLASLNPLQRHPGPPVLTFDHKLRGSAIPTRDRALDGCKLIQCS